MKTLRTILKEKGVSQNVVAEALGVDVSNLRRYDDLSKRSLGEILKIEEATGISFEELTGIKPFSKPFNIAEASKSAVNTGTVGGHNVNIGSSDYQKIIEKDRIELIREEGADKMYLQEINSLKAEITRLEAIIKSKDETIAAKDETIRILTGK